MVIFPAGGGRQKDNLAWRATLQITIKTLQGEVPQDAQEYAQEKVSKLSRFGNGLVGATVNLSEKASKDASKSHLAEIVIHAPGHILRVQEAGKSFEAAVDTASEKLKQQLRKMKTKRLDKTRDHPGLADIVNAENAAGSSGKAAAKRVGQQIYVEKFNIKPMSINEAVLQLKRAKRSFFLFYDTQNHMHCVYKRPDGHIGLLVPESELLEN
jgi:putative sigma-54 modulation protein